LETKMRHGPLKVAGAVLGLLLFVQVNDASAQQSTGWWDWALKDLVEARGGSVADIVPARDRGNRGNDRAQRGASLPDIVLGRDDRDRGARGGGPPFCRNGEGHPVHGPRWCAEKGFGLGGGILRGSRWDVRGWEDVVLRNPRGQQRRGTLDRGGLVDVLGDVVLGRIAAGGSQIGVTGPMTGRWLHADGAATILQIRAGGQPLAELTDIDGDGRVDAVLMPRP
jgi:hypothetical protein